MSRWSPRSPRRISSISARSRRSPTPRPRSSRASSPTASPILPRDPPLRDRLAKAARRHARRIVTFGHRRGRRPRGPCRSQRQRRKPGHRAAGESELTFTIAQRGATHWVPNALAVLAAVEAVGRRPRRRRAGAGRHGRAEGARRAPPLACRGWQLSADRRKLQRQSGVDGAALKALGEERDARPADRGARAMRELGQPRRRRCMPALARR